MPAQVDEYNSRILSIYENQLPWDHEYFANLYNNWGVAIMSNNPEHDDKIYERAINYMNKAEKVNRSRLTSCSLYTVQSITIVTLIQL